MFTRIPPMLSVTNWEKKNKKNANYTIRVGFISFLGRLPVV